MFAYVGGYTTADRDGRGNGINVYRVLPVGGAWTHLQTVEGLENPSLFTLNQAQTRLFCVHGGRALVSAFAIDHPSGHLSLLNQVDCDGTNPVDLALDPTGRFLVVANYGSGAVAVLPVDADGRLSPPEQVHALEGSPGPDAEQQASSHPHAVIFDPSGRFVVVPDKGFDQVFVFHFRDGRLIPTDQAFIESAAGAAPRHAVFHPLQHVLYVNNELDSTVTVLRWHPPSGTATEQQVATTIPGGFAGRNTTAEIAVTSDGRHLYVSNRGQDSIALFDIDPRSGELTYTSHFPSGGAKPRFFALEPDGRHLYVANQDSDDITVFHVDRSMGSLIPTGVRIRVGSPSAISFVRST